MLNGIEGAWGGCSKGIMATFQCATGFTDRDALHNRYLLMSVGWANLPYGMYPTGERGYNDITPLLDEQYRLRWKQRSKAESINVIGDPVVVHGQLE